MARSPIREAPPESDCFVSAPHPRFATTLIGHERAEEAFLDAYKSGRMPHSWIIGGREGIGKATLAWRIAKFLLTHPDFRADSVQNARDLSSPADHPAMRRVQALTHADIALLRRQWNDKTNRHYTEIRIEEVRAALDLFRSSSGEGGWRICIVDSAEDLNRSSANALLKLVEEPPARSLFLFVAHQPARVLVTLRSRSRSLTLEPLDQAEIATVTRTLGPPWSEASAEDLRLASQRADGSVQEALRLLEGEGLRLADQLERLFSALPNVDWKSAQSVADLVAIKGGDAAFRSFLGASYGWIDDQVRAGGPLHRLHPFAEAWDKVAKGARDVESLNLEKRPFVLSVFADLARASAGGGG